MAASKTQYYTSTLKPNVKGAPRQTFIDGFANNFSPFNFSSQMA